jgi:hypothetical protein
VTTATSHGRGAGRSIAGPGPPTDREGEPDQAGGHHGHGGQLGRRSEESPGILLHVAEDEDRVEEIQDAGDRQAAPTQPRCRPPAGHERLDHGDRHGDAPDGVPDDERQQVRDADAERRHIGGGANRVSGQL